MSIAHFENSIRARAADVKSILRGEIQNEYELEYFERRNCSRTLDVLFISPTNSSGLVAHALFRNLMALSDHRFLLQILLAFSHHISAYYYTYLAKDQ